MSRTKNPHWTRGVNITVSEEAHAKIQRIAYKAKKTIRAYMDELVAKVKE